MFGFTQNFTQKTITKTDKKKRHFSFLILNYTWSKGVFNTEIKTSLKHSI